MEWCYIIVIASCIVGVGIVGVGIVVVLIHDMYDYYHRYVELQREYRDLLLKLIKK